ncbi:hypothetical protein HN858_05485 [Candidatus Falkowbacteria bacterium]|jgi:hypothetical protein|nr:hypothetical protein [Candidatus Falkowbacteria bacterium]MBT5502924.1 hypothetical protein [Candidatus Falkowbacteria bacterium]MBT6573712.1 hypothetical protein [Candidatus Falkowbacteria bacterium]MBT7349088.1 hypothetical protein [Candidatus Falkowbacteria bacterium]MBT7500039.1 hypothetical protein [Candidatus Falkowbacteria bacterium]
MKSFEQINEKALEADFTERQQVHFDKLMSELEVISGGLGFAELKVEAEAGSKEALQMMREYITKKEEIVEFIETREFEYKLREKPLKVGDVVICLSRSQFIIRKSFGKAVTIEEIIGEGTELESYVIRTKAGAEIVNGDQVAAVDTSLDITEGSVGLLDLNEYYGVKWGDLYKSQDNPRQEVVIIEFDVLTPRDRRKNDPVLRVAFEGEETQGILRLPFQEFIRKYERKE